MNYYALYMNSATNVEDYIEIKIVNQEQVGKCNLASQSEPTPPAESRAIVLLCTAEKTLKIVNLMLSRNIF